MKKILVITAILAMFTTGCSQESKKEMPVEVSGVEVINIAKTSADDFYETSATVKSKTSSIISSMIMGKVTALRVKEGDNVKVGQPLITIDNRDAAQKALGAKAGVNEAMKAYEAAEQNKKLMNKTYQRYKNLYDEKVMTGQEFDQISTQKKIADIEYQRALQGVNKAKAGLGEVSVYQSYASITAPISGVVVSKNIDLGSIAAPRQPLLTLEAPSNLEVEAFIDESKLSKIKLGMPVYLETQNAVLKSKITSIVQKIDPLTRSFKVKIAVNGLKSGQYVKVKIPVTKKEILLVPQSAIVNKGQLTGIYTVDEENIISYRLIKTGQNYGDKVEVLSGLNSGVKVIITGVEKAVDGGIIK